MKLKRNLNVLAFVKWVKIKIFIISMLVVSLFLLLFLHKGASLKSSQIQDLEKVMIDCKGHKINAAIARNASEKKQGLTNVKNLEDNQGMLFIFQNEQELNFWMKDTYIPLDIAFLNRNQRIIDIYANSEPLNTNKIYTSSRPAKYAIETNANWFSKNDIRINEYCHFDIN